MTGNPAINLPWPPAELSGHNNGTWRGKSKTVKDYREKAFWIVKETGAISVPAADIRTVVTFTPPDNHSDRLNYVNRMKPYFDGIAMALGVNDKLFCIPIYVVMKTDAQNAGVTVQILNGENNDR